MVRLPRVLILMLDADFTKITVGYDHTKRAIAVLISNLIIEIAKRKSQLLKKAYRTTEPKILVMKPTPRAEAFEDLRGSRNQRRIFNRCLENVIAKYDNLFCYNVHKLRPKKDCYFDIAKTNFSYLGYKTYWHAMDDAVKPFKLKPFKEIAEYDKRDKTNGTSSRNE